MLNDFLSPIFEYVNKLSDGNQMIGGAISLWLMGVITYFCRNIPLKVFEFLKKQLTTEIVLTNSHRSETVTSVGYGRHVIWFRNRPIWINLERENSMSERDKEVLTITKIGRSHKMFNELIKDIDCKDDKDDMIEFEVARYGDWRFAGYQPKRHFGSVVIKPEIQQKLVGTIDNFIDREDWYKEHGIPYSLGILLYGPPGTGKTSLIKAIASYLNRKIKTISATALSVEPDLLANVENNCILVVEDIDSCVSAKKRGDDYRENFEPDLIEGQSRSKSSTNENTLTVNDKKESFFSVANLLNAIDGLAPSHGRILIMTTNYIDKLDAAILRPGRCDLKVEISYFDKEMFALFLQRFFEDKDIETDLKDRVLKVDDLTGAKMQQCILLNMTYQEIIDKYTEKV